MSENKSSSFNLGRAMKFAVIALPIGFVLGAIVLTVTGCDLDALAMGTIAAGFVISTAVVAGLTPPAKD